MMFTKRLREPVMRGEITCSVRIWQRPHVKVGGRYPLGDGAIEVTSIKEITEKQITASLARRGGFAGVEDLMAVAKHGPGDHIYLVEFKYEPNLAYLPLVQKKAKPMAKSAARK
jgi:hypothetical protein